MSGGRRDRGPAGRASDLGEARAEYAGLLRRSLAEVTRVLGALPGVRRVSLVGSHARGRSDLCTDLDILVVMETDKAFVERLEMLYPLLAVPVDLDLICYTPEEFEEMKGRPFLKALLRDEVVLHEKQRA